jgi:hypothetical protein
MGSSGVIPTRSVMECGRPLPLYPSACQQLALVTTKLRTAQSATIVPIAFSCFSVSWCLCEIQGAGSHRGAKARNRNRPGNRPLCRPWNVERVQDKRWGTEPVPLARHWIDLLPTGNNLLNASWRTE